MSRSVLILALAELGLALLCSPAARAASEEYNFSWLDPEKKIYVLQNRKYLKANRLFISAMLDYGIASPSPYRTVYGVDPRIAYYFSEAFGVEGFYTFMANSTNTNFAQLTTASPNAFPDIREVKSQYGGMFHYVPWYAKINVFNEILYFDWYFAAGAGQIHSNVISKSGVNGLTTTTDNRFALFLGTGQQFHLSQDWSVRVDFTGAYYRSPLRVANPSGDSAWFSHYNFGIGIGYRL